MGAGGAGDVAVSAGGVVVVKAMKWALGAVLALCIARLWLMPLPSSFWVDEMGTVFVVRHGGGDPSFVAVPQVPESIYYWLPKAAEAALGTSEVAYRIPSILVLGLALVFIARLAARLIHPGAGWLAVFVCLGLKGVNYAAADARPYALGMCVAGASLLMLARWMDSARWWDAAGFGICGALLWRVHLTFWPIYVVLAMYATVRLTRRDTKVGWLAAGAVFGLVGLALIPVLAEALALMRQAKAHVVAPAPSVAELVRALKIGLVAGCGAVAWALGRISGWRWNPKMAEGSTALVVGFWVGQPVCLFAFSWLTGDSVFVNRYLSVGLPGVALAATAAAGRFIPAEWWRPLSAAFGVGVLLLLGQWSKSWPPHHNSDWRGAARMVNSLAPEESVPVICPSPFIEARPPVWRPDYRLPGFLYCQLEAYPIRGKELLFPFETSPEAETYAAGLANGVFSRRGRFVLYGGNEAVGFWRGWFARRPEMAGWNNRRAGRFGDVDVVVFERR